MKFVKQSFMGIELDILVGHPEHDILFIATQVATASGLASPRQTVNNVRRYHGLGRHLQDVISTPLMYMPTDSVGRALKSTTIMFTEGETYRVLLKGQAPQSEPFRKWVTEEVLPSIRKTGKFDANEAQDKESIQLSGEFAQLHAAISELTGEVRSLKDIIAGLQIPSLEGAYDSAHRAWWFLWAAGSN